MELYKREEKKVKEITIFPGYVFIYTDFNINEIHEILKDCHIELNFAFREPTLKERWMGDLDFLYKKLEDEMLCNLTDLDEEETDFLNLLRQGNGLLAMSYGYEENNNYHVVEGPLKIYEDKIQRVGKHNRKGQVRAGFECKPKMCWYPEKETQIVTLVGGVEINLEELKKDVMII